MALLRPSLLESGKNNWSLSSSKTSLLAHIPANFTLLSSSVFHATHTCPSVRSLTMKRRTEDAGALIVKRSKLSSAVSDPVLGEDLVFEVLRHADAATLARAACVSKQWRRTAEDERLWEGVCTRRWTNMGCGVLQLRSVVLALGGFRRLHSLYLLPLLHRPCSSVTVTAQQNSFSSSSSLLPIMPFSSITPPASASTSVSSPSPSPSRTATQKRARWGKDEVNLSLSLLSIQHYYEKMGMNSKPNGWKST